MYALIGRKYINYCGHDVTLFIKRLIGTDDLIKEVTDTKQLILEDEPIVIMI